MIYRTLELLGLVRVAPLWAVAGLHLAQKAISRKKKKSYNNSTSSLPAIKLTLYQRRKKRYVQLKSFSIFFQGQPKRHQGSEGKRAEEARG